MASFRPLQPAPMQEQTPQPEARPPLAQKPKRTVTLGACVACKCCIYISARECISDLLQAVDENQKYETWEAA